MSKISLIIPTYKRLFDFERTLKSIKKQTGDIDEVITIIGPNDLESYTLAKSFENKIKNLKVLQNKKASVVSALNNGLLNSTHDIICLTDDDIELPEGWAKRIKKAFVDNEEMGAYGGPDKLISDKYKNLGYNPVSEVGLFKWNKMIGGHHLGVLNSPANVDVLKGVNFSFKRETLKDDLLIDTFLEDKGAEQCWEIDLVQKIQLNGYKVIYDNDNFLFHYIGQRQQYDKRTDVFAELNYKNLKNITYVYAKFRPFNEVLFLILNQLFKGSKYRPGIFRSIIMIKTYGFRVLLLPFKYIKPMIIGLINGYRNRFQKNK